MNTKSVMMYTVGLAVMLAGPVQAADDWQEKMLFAPSDTQLALEESRDRVMIYHGLTDVQVARAMDRQFERIEHMMFTGTVVTDEQGEALVDPDTGQAQVEDDGC
jgi:hypothetical protein